MWKVQKNEKNFLVIKLIVKWRMILNDLNFRNRYRNMWNHDMDCIKKILWKFRLFSNIRIYSFSFSFKLKKHLNMVFHVFYICLFFSSRNNLYWNIIFHLLKSILIDQVYLMMTSIIIFNNFVIFHSYLIFACEDISFIRVMCILCIYFNNKLQPSGEVIVQNPR